jgi:Fur family transcriptional regulator, ferric uptake regulator
VSNDFSLGEVQVSLSPKERFEEFLQSRGKRTTQQRRALVDFIFERHDHFNADELIDAYSLRHQGEKISRPTVYRTLDQLVEAGLLRKMTLGGRAVFEHDYGYPQHDHLICKQCGSLTEFTNDAISRTLEDVAAEHGFRMEGHRMEVYGLCQNCSQPPQRRHPMLDRI